ncbi:hypothetical protein J2Z35_001749 [Acetoanaerobium pronyense]|uniref:Uncharacterized protein n=1 Tax=Acetoanaerobium pronyense TaxID=1482736 RepID=A0ABS4KL43_9FIRM|nr:hypothetical protein [Acetoanaerobium pronyense]MBP2027951.1 hypothetical protein [Acetoanaerobium pronyense]
MSQAIVRILSGVSYNYKSLNNYFESEELERYGCRFIKRTDKLVQGWNDNLHSEWIVRNYLACKMILASTLFCNSLEYSIEKNVMITESYLIYYTLLSACRALVLTSPETLWNNGQIVTMSHSKIIKNTSNILKSISSEEGERIIKFITLAKDNRELFSYAFPSNGKNNQISKIDLIELEEITRCLLELAQFNSERLEKSFFKADLKEEYKIKEEYFFKVVEYKYGGRNFVDREDYYRLGYITRKQPFPLNLWLTFSEGMVEDFFSSWWIEECNDESDLFNPDFNIRVLFDLP